MLPRQLQHWSAWEPRDHLILVIMDRMPSPGAPALHHDFTPKQKFGPDTMGLRLWRSSFLLQLLRKVCVCPVELSSISNTRRRVWPCFQATRSNISNTRDMQCFSGISGHREESWKHDAQWSLFYEIRSVWIADETLSRVFDISSQSKQKLRSKRGSKIVKISAD